MNNLPLHDILTQSLLYSETIHNNNNNEDEDDEPVDGVSDMKSVIKCPTKRRRSSAEDYKKKPLQCGVIK